MPAPLLRRLFVVLACMAWLAVPGSAAAAPSASLHSFVEGVNPSSQFNAGSTLWFNPAVEGDFTVRVAAAHPSGIASVQFQSGGLAAGWSVTSPALVTSPSAGGTYDVTYHWDAGAANLGLVTAIVTAVDGSSSTVDVEALDDAVGPGGGTLSYPDGYVVAAGIELAATRSIDVGSGLASETLERRSASVADGVCGVFGAWSAVAGTAVTSTMTVTVSDGTCVQYRVRARDMVGNDTFVAPAQVTVRDAGAPDGGDATVAPLTGTERQVHVAGTTYVGVDGSGSFTVAVTATDFGSGVARVVFPSLGDGWTGGGVDASAPYEATYSWAPGAEASGTVVATAFDGAGRATLVALPLVIDAAAPSGGWIDVPGGTTNAPSAEIVAHSGVDAASGISTWQLRRRLAALAGGACGSWNAWTDLGPAGSVAPVTDALTSGACIEYQLRVTDRVGNVATVAAATTRVDRGQPYGSIDAPTRVPGSMLLTISGDASDATTNVAAVSVRLSGAAAGSVCSSTVSAASRWGCAWDPTGMPAGTYTLVATILDAAGNVSEVSRTVDTGLLRETTTTTSSTPTDLVPPVVTLEPVQAVSWERTVELVGTSVDDVDRSSLEVTYERRSAQARGAPWTAWTTTGEISTLPARGETTCFRARSTDRAGNVGTSASRCTTTVLDDRALRRRGVWRLAAVPGAWVRTVARSARVGASLEVTVRDKRPVLVVAPCERCGSIRVYHGARLLGTWSLATNSPRTRQLIRLPVLTVPWRKPIRVVATSKRPVQVDGIIAKRLEP